MNQKGFAPIVIVLIIMGVLAVGGAGYFGVKQYQKSQNKKVETENVVVGEQVEEKKSEELDKNTETNGLTTVDTDKRDAPQPTEEPIVYPKTKKLATIIGGLEGVDMLNDPPTKKQALYNIVFLPQLQKVIYSIDYKTLMVNGVVLESFDFSVRPIFSADQKRVAYIGRSGAKISVIVDGYKVGEYDEIKRDNSNSDFYLFGFSSKNKKFAFVAQRNGKWFMVEDGREGKSYDDIKMFSFSQNEEFVAFVAKEGDKWMIVKNNQENKKYNDIISLKISPDGRRLAYIAGESGQYFVVIDNQEGPHYAVITDITFSPNGQKVAYIAGGEKFRPSPTAVEYRNYFVVFDGLELKKYQNTDGSPAIRDLTLSPDGQRIAYRAKTSTFEEAVVIDEQEDKSYSSAFGQLSHLTFSPDSKTFVYFFSTENPYPGKSFVVVNGKAGNSYDYLHPSAITLDFSPDSKTFSYWAKKNNRGFFVINDKEQSFYSLSPMSYINNLPVYMGGELNGKKGLVVDGILKNPTDAKFFYSWHHFATNSYSEDSIISQNGDKIAYIASIDDEKQFVVVGDKKSALYDEIFGPVLWGTDNTITYGAINGNDILLVTDATD